MIVKILGVLDFISSFLILFAFIFPDKVFFFIAVYLIAKGGTFAFMGDIASWIDIFCGLYALLMSFGITFHIVSVIIVLYLLQKAFFSII